MSDERAVTVATLTFRRPAELRRLLPLLVAQAAALTPPAQVLVVDNDPDGGAADEVAAWSDAGVRYAHEPQPGIAAARNRALDAAADSAAIVFIDDDETPAEGWLAHLVEQWRLSGAAAVGGPAIKVVDANVDTWVTSSGLFERWQFPTGTKVQGAATNNLLLDVAQLHRFGLRFDERFGLTGGSDTMLIKSLIRRGGEVVWCDEAQVLDPLPAHRLTRQWVRRRFLRTGNTWVRVALALPESPGARNRARLRLAALALTSLCRGVARLAAGTLTAQQALRAQGVCRICSASGGLLACAGHVYGEYLRTPSDDNPSRARAPEPDDQSVPLR